MVSVSTFISTSIVFTAVAIGVLLSPIPRSLGLYRWVASVSPVWTGMTPAFHDGIEWQYTFEDFHQRDCPKLSGQTALVTGANSGVGYEVARALAKCGVDVVMACRNEKRCSAAADKIRKEAAASNATSEISTMVVDTSSLKSVRAFSERFLLKHQDKALDMLYLNAGITFAKSEDGKLTLSEDGVEMTFATNYLGHHLMYRYLEPLLLKSEMARVVLTASSASFETFDHKVATSLEVLNSPDKPAVMKHYGQSKLAQILWAKHLTRLLGGDDSRVYVNACHPGAVDTMIWGKEQFAKFPSFITRIIDYTRTTMMWTAEEGALTQLYLGIATDELRSRNVRGKYFHPQAQEVVNPFSLDEKLQKDLWEFSNELVADFL